MPRERCGSWDKCKELAEAGVYAAKAARIMGIHHTTALYISRQMGFKWPKAPRGSWSRYIGPSQRQIDVILANCQTRGVTSIARELGVRRPTIRQWAAKNGVTFADERRIPHKYPSRRKSPTMEPTDYVEKLMRLARA